MSKANDAKATYCPSCGASINMGDVKGTCAFCGTEVERPQERARVVQKTVITTTQTPAKPNVAGGCISLVIVVALIGIAIFAWFTESVGRTVPNILEKDVTPNGWINSVEAIVPRDGSGYDLLVYVRDSGDDMFSLARFDGASHEMKWQSAKLSKDAYQGQVVTLGDMIYVADQSRLLALRLSDGSQFWQTSLAVELPSSCKECLTALNNRVIALQKDGSLQAFDVQSGQLAWSKRLSGTPRELPVVGGKLVVTEPRADNDGLIINFLDPATGAPAQRIEPSCQPPDQPFNRPEHFDTSDLMKFSADGSTMYTVYGFFAKCAQRWDIATGAATWETPIDRDALPPTWSNYKPLLADQSLILNKDASILQVMDLNNGALRTLFEDKENNLSLFAVRDNTLIVLAEPTWDSERHALWGIDLTTGERRWQYAVTTKGNPAFAGNTRSWNTRLTPQGLVVIQILEDEGKLMIDQLDPQTGVSAHQSTTELEKEASFTLWPELFTDDMVWVQYAGAYHAIDLATGAVVHRLE